MNEETLSVIIALLIALTIVNTVAVIWLVYRAGGTKAQIDNLNTKV